ncbi:MAG: hypothetical protein A2W05_09710 [Candidatus Schekmanbacteria bacterium RBG_16_38_10]|uniref:N-acetyltransferase domain-containing protein n=1 Tax=Candidatus Schekmanbacteria bacterium RBG_16_38_10 TaxID=1817879 RepID=A0A1F7RX47_9BACT|nr:MAG: hypothetical protein A2W05_09710 [Candidatus Schekmanbacteria bacterium RBG_16_38_10]
MEIRTAQTQNEVEEALEMLCKFFPPSYYEHKTMKNIMRQYLTEDFTPQCMIVGVDNNRIVAVFRYYPRRMIIAGVEFEILGLSDYCIDSSYSNNTIVGVNFLMKCCEMLKETQYPLAIGSARRIMSNYYYRFGFIGCNSYCKCKIETLKLPSTPKQNIQFNETFNEINIENYERLRRETFSSEWGLIIRTTDFWRWIGHQISHFKKYRFFEIQRDSKLVGYFIISGNDFIDYGIESAEFETHIYELFSFLWTIINKDNLVINLSPNNKIFRSFGLSNLSYTMRFVPDEGVIAIGLNKEKLVALFSSIVSNSCTGLYSLNSFTIGDSLNFIYSDGKLTATFEPDKMKRKDEQILLNSLFQGTYGPLSLMNFGGPHVIPPTFFRINDLDGL